jgi:hypothetical protein
MSNRIVGPNGAPLPSPEKPPANVTDMVQRAKRMWREGDKQAAFDQLCESNLLLTKGIARLFSDVKELKERITPK